MFRDTGRLWADDRESDCLFIRIQQLLDLCGDFVLKAGCALNHRNHFPTVPVKKHHPHVDPLHFQLVVFNHLELHRVNSVFPRFVRQRLIVFRAGKTQTARDPRRTLRILRVYPAGSAGCCRTDPANCP